MMLKYASIKNENVKIKKPIFFIGFLEKTKTPDFSKLII